jgi:hypothetical protein
MTKTQAKSILFKLGIEFGVNPAHISTKLLSKEDKQDMLEGLVPMETLKTAVRLWKDAGQPDYVNG